MIQCPLYHRNEANVNISNIKEAFPLYFKLFLWVKGNTFAGPDPKERENDPNNVLDRELFNTCLDETKSKFKILNTYIEERKKDNEIVNFIIHADFTDIDISNRYKYLFDNLYSSPPLYQSHLSQEQYENITKSEIIVKLVMESLELFSFNNIKIFFNYLGKINITNYCKFQWKQNQRTGKYFIKKVNNMIL